MKQVLLNRIIKKYEGSSKDWRGDAAGNRSFLIQQEDYDAFGKECLIQEAKELEQQGLIRVKWFNNRSDIEEIRYSLEAVPQIYGMLGLVPKKERFERARDYAGRRLESVRSEWIRRYYEFLAGKLAEGKWPGDLDKYGKGCLWSEAEDVCGEPDYKNILHQCLDGLDLLEEPVYKRIFSKHCLGDSKVFEHVIQTRVISLARNFHSGVEASMNDSQVLSQLGIEEYSQELSVKGDLVVCLDGRIMDLSGFRYGISLNSEMLKHIRISPEQRIREVVTVENKANFMSMPYEPETLVVFSHGYFSPKEREVLCELEHQLRGKDVVYLHTGDLDYGGIQIFRFIRNRIFPELQPYLMDVGQYEKYLERGQAIEAETLEKLRLVKEPLLQPLIDKMLECGVGIEQESFLI